MAEEYRDYSKSPTMSEARSTGLWHPNCGHSVSIFIPGITEERDLSWKQDYSEQYKLRQDANYAKRQTKQWERRAELAKANGDQMAYKTAKNKAKEYRQKQKEIAQKRAELDKKQREARFSQPRGKAFPLDSSSLKNQKNEDKGQSKSSTKPSDTQKAKDTEKLKKKVEKAKKPKSYPRTHFYWEGSPTPSWNVGDKVVNSITEFRKAVIREEYLAREYKKWWNDKSKELITDKMSPPKLLEKVANNPEYKEAFYTYTTGAYRTINGVLRGLKTRDQIKGSADYFDKCMNAVKVIDKFLDKDGRLGKDTLLYRAMDFKGIFGDNSDAIKAFANEPESFIGMTWSDKGYTSTSPNYNGIQHFLFEADVILHIYAEKDTKGLYIAQWSEYKTECEFLLARDTSFRMVDCQKDSEGKIHMMVEILN